MLGTILWIVGCIAVGIICYLIGRSIKQDNEYWRGRGEGWKACEDMVMERAEELPQYDHEKLWVDLVQ